VDTFETEAFCAEGLKPMKGEQFMHNRSPAPDHDSWTSMFEPDVLAVARYMEKWRYQGSQDPEKTLMYAVLEDAVTCFQRFSSVSSARGRAAFKDAENWLMHEKSDWPFSFERICEALNLDPNYLRTGLERWRSGALAQQIEIRLFYVVRTGPPEAKGNVGGFHRESELPHEETKGTR
jgi:hypothetical protein